MLGLVQKARFPQFIVRNNFNEILILLFILKKNTSRFYLFSITVHKYTILSIYIYIHIYAVFELPKMEEVRIAVHFVPLEFQVTRYNPAPGCLHWEHLQAPCMSAYCGWKNSYNS